MKKKVLIGVAALVLIPVIIYFFFPQVLLLVSVKKARKAAHLTKKSIVVEKNTIVYLEGGTGVPVVLLHGLAGNKDYWPAFAKSITPSFRVIALDLPGSGESTKNIADLYNAAAQSRRLAAILAALQVEKPHLAGHAMGGLIAVKYAATYPGAVRSLTLIDTEGIKSPEMSEFEKKVAEGVNPLQVTNAAEMKNVLAFLFVKPPHVPGPILGYMAKQSVKNGEFNQKIYWDIFGEDYYIDRDLPKIKVPVMVLWGANDRKADVSAVTVIRQVKKDAIANIIPDCGHMPMREKPAESAMYYLDFLKSH